MSSEVKLIEDWRERWHDRFGDVKIITVIQKKDGSYVAIGENEYGGLQFVIGSNLIPKPRPKTFRPWRREEVPVGSVVRNRTADTLFVITGVSSREICLDIWWSFAFVLSEFVLHRTTESGEWLPVEQCRPCGVEE